MTGYTSIQAAIRARLQTLVVLSTGAVQLTTSGSRYVRTEGSFVDDGFARGMEVTAIGFSGAGSGVAVVTEATDLELSVDRHLGDDAAAAGEISVLLPTLRYWENEAPQEPMIGVPYVEERFIPGPRTQISATPAGWIELTPQYGVLIHVQADTGSAAASRYADAVIAHFLPRDVITLEDGAKLRVRSDTAPWRSDIQQSRPGWAVVPVTIPFRLHTTAHSI